MHVACQCVLIEALELLDDKDQFAQICIAMIE